MEAALNSAASLCLERRLSIIREILAGDIESENYRVEQRMRTTRRVAPERIGDFEHISLAELDALLSPAEQRRFITAESAPVGKPFIIRRDA
jgi:hypothetical protein